MGGQQFHARDPVLATLGVGVEVAQGVDLVVEQVDTQRRLGAHREEVDQRAAQGVFAGFIDRLHGPVAGPRQGVAKALAVEGLAGFQRHHAPGDVVDRWQALHQGVHGRQHDAVLAVLQPAQRAQPRRDDILVRREAVVGQRLPVGEGQHRQVAIEAQVTLQALGRGGVGRDHQQRRVLGQVGQGQGAGAARRCLPVEGVAQPLGARRVERREIRHAIGYPTVVMSGLRKAGMIPASRRACSPGWRSVKRLQPVRPSCDCPGRRRPG